MRLVRAVGVMEWGAPLRAKPSRWYLSSDLHCTCVVFMHPPYQRGKGWSCHRCFPSTASVRRLRTCDDDAISWHHQTRRADASAVHLGAPRVKSSGTECTCVEHLPTKSWRILSTSTKAHPPISETSNRNPLATSNLLTGKRSEPRNIVQLRSCQIDRVSHVAFCGL